MGLNILWVILSLAGVLGLFFILVYATKKLNSGLGFVNGSRMKVLDRVSLGRDGMLVVVCVGGKLMLIGTSGQHIEKLADIDMTPEEYMASGGAGNPVGSGVAGSAGGMSFSAALAEMPSRSSFILPPAIIFV